MKKMTLFFATPVRKMVEKDPKFAALPGLHKAIGLPRELVRAVLEYDFGSSATGAERGEMMHRIVWDEFQLRDHVYNNLRRAVSESHRIEGTIRLTPIPAHAKRRIRLELLFFRRNEKYYFFYLVFEIELDTAKTCDVWYHWG